MQIPILLVATAIGAGTLGYYVGRKERSAICVVSSGCVRNENDNEDKEQPKHQSGEREQQENASTAARAPECSIPAFLARQLEGASTETAAHECSIPVFLYRQVR